MFSSAAGALSGTPAPPPPSDAQLTVVTDDAPAEEKTPDLTKTTVAVTIADGKIVYRRDAPDTTTAP